METTLILTPAQSDNSEVTAAHEAPDFFNLHMAANLAELISNRISAMLSGIMHSEHLKEMPSLVAALQNTSTLMYITDLLQKDEEDHLNGRSVKNIEFERKWAAVEARGFQKMLITNLEKSTAGRNILERAGIQQYDFQ